MSHAARLVLWVVSIVVLAYVAADIFLAFKNGKLEDASRRVQDISLGALIAFIAQTRAQSPTQPQPVKVTNTEDEPVVTEEKQAGA